MITFPSLSSSRFSFVFGSTRRTTSNTRLKSFKIFTYALYPHAETWRSAETVAQAYFLNQPVRATAGGIAGEAYSLSSVDAKNVILETVKQAEDGDGVIVRLYECENARTTTKLHWNRPIASVTECDLQENALTDVPVEGGTFKFTIKPYEIKTFRIR